MNLDAMKELLAAVEADDLQSDIWRDIWRHDKSLPMHDAHYAKQAHKGDMNAAFALFGALLPGWVGQVDTAGFAIVWRKDEEGCDTDQATLVRDKPARALLIATLKGKIAEMGEPI